MFLESVLKNVFFKLVEFYNVFFKVFDFQVYKVYMTYNFDGVSDDRTLTKFWFIERFYWLFRGRKESHLSDVTKKYQKKLDSHAPKGVSDIVYHIKYSYNNKKYTCVTKDPCISLPNKKNEGATFRMPIAKVELLDPDQEPVMDVTRKYVKLAGPYNDFHNCENIIVKDLFFYDDYKYIRVTNILKQTKVVDKYSTPSLLL